MEIAAILCLIVNGNEQGFRKFYILISQGSVIWRMEIQLHDAGMSGYCVYLDLKSGG
jgi:hypothetical protein